MTNSSWINSPHNLGIIFIYDLLDEKSKLYSFNYVQNVLKARMDFVEYAELKKAIQQRQVIM